MTEPYKTQYVKEPMISKIIQKITSELKLLESVNGKTSEDYLYKNHMGEVVQIVEDIDNFCLRLRRGAVNFYDFLLCVQGSSFEDTSSEKAFDKKLKPAFRGNISVRHNGNCIEITMPPLIKNITAKSKHYIYYCVSEAIKEYKTHNDLPKFYGHSVVIICSKRANWDRLYDADNVEINGAINALTPYFFVDDSPKYLSVYRMGMEAGEASTTIYLMPLNEFPAWLIANQTGENGDLSD